MAETKQIKSPLPSGEKYLDKESLTKIVSANKGIIDFTAEPLYSFRVGEGLQKLNAVVELLKGNKAVKTLKIDVFILSTILPFVLDCFADENCQINSLVISGRVGNPSELLKAILAANTNQSLTAFYFPFNACDRHETKKILTQLTDYKQVRHLDIHKRRFDGGYQIEELAHKALDIYDALIKFIKANKILESLDLGCVWTTDPIHLKGILDTIRANVPWCAFGMLPTAYISGNPEMTAIKEISEFAKNQKVDALKRVDASKQAELLDQLGLLPPPLNQIVSDYLQEKSSPALVPYHTNDPKLKSLNDPVKFLKGVFTGCEKITKEEWPIWMAECFRQLIDKLCRYQDEAGLLATFQYLLKRDNVICASFPIPSKLQLYPKDRWAKIADSIHDGLSCFLAIILFKAFSGKDKKNPMVHLVLDDPMQSGLGKLIAEHVVRRLLKMGCPLWGPDSRHCKSGEEIQKVDTSYHLRIELSDYQKLHQEFNLASYGLPEHPPVFGSQSQEAKEKVSKTP